MAGFRQDVANAMKPKEEINMTKAEVVALIDERIKVALEGKGTEASAWAKEELARRSRRGSPTAHGRAGMPSARKSQRWCCGGRKNNKKGLTVEVSPLIFCAFLCVFLVFYGCYGVATGKIFGEHFGL